MYTRNFNRTPRYNPPPGYVGNAFSPGEEGKHHEPQDELHQKGNRRPITPVQEPSNGDCPPQHPEPEEYRMEKEAESSCEAVPAHHEDSPVHGTGELTQLLEYLRGKVGKEELILLTVMLLIASDGLRAEVIILALMLFVH